MNDLSTHSGPLNRNLGINICNSSFIQPVITKSCEFVLLNVFPLHCHYLSSALCWIIATASFFSFLPPISAFSSQSQYRKKQAFQIHNLTSQWLPTAYSLGPGSFPCTPYNLSFQPDVLLQRILVPGPDLALSSLLASHVLPFLPGMSLLPS